MANRYTILFLFFIFLSFGQVVEPVFQWGDNVGSTNAEVMVGVVSDSDGNVYLNGNFQGTGNFGIGGETHTLSTTTRSPFIIKYNTNGEVVWSGQYITSYLDCTGIDIGIDNNNNLYATGRFYGNVDFDLGLGIYYMSANMTPTPNMDIYLTKLNNDGGFLWAKQIRGEGAKTIEGFTVDELGNSYITGCFNKPITFPDGTILTPQNPIWTGANYDIFIAKFDTNGNILFVKQIGSGPYTQRPTAIKVDTQGNIYIGGIFVNPTDFDPSSSEFIISPQTPNNIASFLLKLDPNGNFIWVKNIGSTGHMEFSSMLVDSANIIYVSGSFTGTADFNPSVNVDNLITALGSNFFLLKLDDNGDFQWVRVMEAVGRGKKIQESAMNRVLIAGEFAGTCDFSGGNNTSLFSSQSGSNDAFLAEYESNGDVNWVKTFGGVDGADVASLDYNASGAVHLAGNFEGTVQFGTTTDIFSTTSYGSYDGYLMKFDEYVLGNEDFGISDLELMIYPNPSTSTINISFPDTFEQGSYKIFSVNGQLIMKNELQRNINVSSLSSGFYFITILKDDKSITAKFLKK